MPLFLFLNLVVFSKLGLLEQPCKNLLLILGIFVFWCGCWFESTFFHNLVLFPYFLFHSRMVSLSIVSGQFLPMIFFGFQQILPLTGVQIKRNIPNLRLKSRFHLSNLMDIVVPGTLWFTPWGCVERYMRGGGGEGIFGLGLGLWFCGVRVIEFDEHDVFKYLN